MHFYWMSLFLIGLLTVMPQLPSVAAEHRPPLICNVTQQPGGLFSHQLSRSPSSLSCSTGWETENRTVIAVESTFDSDHVQNLTVNGIIMRRCWEYLHYTETCDGIFEEAHCRVNCSSLVNLSPRPSLPTVNSTMTCLFQSWCPNSLIFWICITIISVLVVVAVITAILFLRKYIPNPRGGSSYSPANGQIKDGEIEMVRRDDIV